MLVWWKFLSPNEGADLYLTEDYQSSLKGTYAGMAYIGWYESYKRLAQPKAYKWGIGKRKTVGSCLNSGKTVDSMKLKEGRWIVE